MLILTMICWVGACAEAGSKSPCEPSAEVSRNLVLSFYKKALN